MARPALQPPSAHSSWNAATRVSAAGLSPATLGATITAGRAYALIFGQQPTNTVQEGRISPAPTVLVVDHFGHHRASEESGRSVTMGLTHCASNFLGGETVVATSHGTATFVKIGSNEVATGCVLVASSVGLVKATSEPFDVLAGSPPA